jgi:hypothetical protein
VVPWSEHKVQGFNHTGETASRIAVVVRRPIGQFGSTTIAPLYKCKYSFRSLPLPNNFYN